MSHTPNDQTLVMFYSLYSQEQWATGWIGDPSCEPHATDFVLWLKVRLSRSVNHLIPNDLDTEQTLHTLRNLWNASDDTNPR